jgi:hypothetical protein
MEEDKMLRRIGLIILIPALLFLAACETGTPPVTTVIVTRIVEETRIVEQTRIVQETQIVTVEATRLVKETVIVTPTPIFLPRVETTQVISLRVPRAQHTATLLTDGSVLFAGGSISPTQQTAEVEIYDPATGITFQAAPLQTARHAHSATLLQDGRVLVVGGSNHLQGWLDDAELYDPSTNEWLVIPPPTSHGVEHTATLMNDGRVLVVGGAIGGSLQTGQVDIFDPQNNSWVSAASLPSDRASHTAILLNDGRVLIIGGGSAAGIPLGGDAMLYDPQLDSWTPTVPMVMPRINAEAILLPDGKVLVAGGINLADTLVSAYYPLPSSSVEIFDPVTNTWSATDDLTEPRIGHLLVSLQDGQVLAIGGAHDEDCCLHENSFDKEIEIYDPGTSLWHIAGELPQAGIYSAAVLLPDGRVWVTGGRNGESGANFLADTWLVHLTSPRPYP